MKLTQIFKIRLNFSHVNLCYVNFRAVNQV